MLLLLAIQGALSLLFFRGYLGGDDYPYTVLSAEMVDVPDVDSQGFAPYFAVRKALLAPIALAFAFFGQREWAALVPMLLLALGMTAGVYGLGRVWLGPWHGLWAAALMLAVPFNLRSGTLILADGPVVTWTVLGLLALTAASTRTSLSRDGRRSTLLALAALAFAAAWLTKASVACMVPIVIVLLIRHLRVSPRPRADAALFVGLCTLAVAAEMIGYHLSRGDWLYRATAVAETNARFAHLWDGILTPHRFLVAGPRALFSHIMFGLVPLASLPAAAWAVWRRRHLGLVAWIVYLVLFFNFMSTSFRFYQPLRPVTIYFYFLIVPEVLLIAAFLVEELPCIRRRLARHWPRADRWLRNAPAATIAAFLAFACLAESRNHNRNSVHLRHLVAVHAQQPPGTAVYFASDRYAWGCHLLAGAAAPDACRRLGRDSAPDEDDLLAILAPSEGWEEERRALMTATGGNLEAVTERPDLNLALYRLKRDG